MTTKPHLRHLTLVLLMLCLPAAGIESGTFRLLSVTETSKMILISHTTTKTKYLLDAGAAKITLDGKPAEFGTLKRYSTAQVFFQLKRDSKDGIEVDGTATEIRLTTSPPPTPRTS